MRIEMQTELRRRYPKSFRTHGEGQPATAFDTWGVECGDGWFALIDRLAGDCERDIEALILQGLPEKLWPRVTQIKEKTGSLRFRVYQPAPTGEPLGKILTLGLEESRCICERFGNCKIMGPNMGGRTMCRNCVEWTHRQWRRNFQGVPRDYRPVYESAPRFLAFFKRWLTSVGDEMPVPLRIENRTQTSMRLSFANSREFLHVNVFLGEINVSSHWEGQCIDYLVSLDMHAPLRDRQGRIVCGNCDPNERAVYATVEEFWEFEVFRSFLHWVKEHYAPAKWLGMYRSDGGASWANLRLEAADPGVGCLVCIPLQLGGEEAKLND